MYRCLLGDEKKKKCMSLLQTVEEDYKKAFRGSDKPVIEVLRIVKTALQNEEIAKRGKTGEREAKLTDDEVLAILKRQVKQTEEAGEFFLKGGRADLKTKNDAELVILKKYLPAQASEDQVRKAVEKVLSGMVGAKSSDFGKIMGAVMKELKGADGTVVSKVVKELLG